MTDKISKWIPAATFGIVALILVVMLVGGNQSAPSSSFGGTTNFDAITLDSGNLTLTNGSIIGSIATLTGALTQGGGIRATSTVNSAETLLASDFDTENVIDYTGNVSDVALTLPASSTLSSFVPTAGQCREVVLRDATTTAAIDITLVGGSGTLLKGVSTSTASTVAFKTILGDTDGSNFALLNFCRKANTDIIVDVIPFND